MALSKHSETTPAPYLADEDDMDTASDVASNLPYQFGGGQWSDPRGDVGGLNGRTGATVITNGIEWQDDGSRFDQDAQRLFRNGQEDC